MNNTFAQFLNKPHKLSVLWYLLGLAGIALFTYLDMYWFLLIILVLIMIGVLVFNVLLRCFPIKVKRILLPIFFVLFSFFNGIVVKQFFVDIYHIPSNSMEDALLTNDVITVNKLAYGPLTPTHVSDIAWLNIIPASEIGSLTSLFGHKFRLKGYDRIKRMIF